MSKQENDDQAPALAQPKNDTNEKVSDKEASDKVISEPVISEKPAQASTTMSNSAMSNTPAPTKKSGNGVAWFAVLLSLTSLGLLGAGGYYGYQMHTQLQAEKQQLQSAQSEQLTTQLQQLQTQLNNQVNQATAKITQAQQQKANEINQQLANNITTVNDKVAEISGRQPSDWAIAEANYLVRMAGRKLWLENDSQTAQHLLATADLRIAELSNPALMPIRQAIVADIAVVRALPQPRITDIHLALSGLISQLDALPLNYVEEHRQPLKTQQTPSVSGDLADWQQNLTTSVSALFAKLFYINTGTAEGSSEPYKMPRQQWFLRANVQHAWLQAQSALLTGNQAIYQDALKRSIKWLGHFKQTDSGVKAAVVTLNSLLKDPITAEYPNKLQSQVILEQTLRERLLTVPTLKPEVQAPQAAPQSVPQPKSEQSTSTNTQVQQQGQAL